MLIAQSNGYRTMTPSAFRLVPYEPRFHCAILSSDEYKISRENEGFVYGTKEVRLPQGQQKQEEE